MPPEEAENEKITAAADSRYMDMALELGRQATRRGEVPVGAIVVLHGPGGDKVIGSGANLREAQCDPTAHAEVVAMRMAGRRLGHWRLVDCTLYVTLEPCPMCAGAMVNARLRRLVYGCTDPKAGAAGTLLNLLQDPRLNHRVPVSSGVRAAEAAALLQEFFRERRGRR